MEALTYGIYPGFTRRVWTMNPTIDNFRTVSAYTQASARLSFDRQITRPQRRQLRSCGRRRLGPARQ
jgi:hypothetical protein